MSYVKRQLARKKHRQSTETMDKTAGCSRTELERADYVLRYGKDWVKHWWKDHLGVYAE